MDCAALPLLGRAGAPGGSHPVQLFTSFSTGVAGDFAGEGATKIWKKASKDGCERLFLVRSSALAVIRRVAAGGMPLSPNQILSAHQAPPPMQVPTRI